MNRKIVSIEFTVDGFSLDAHLKHLTRLDWNIQHYCRTAFKVNQDAHSKVFHSIHGSPQFEGV